nr:YtxH domain-containing protein [Longicatena caecimuris]
MDWKRTGKKLLHVLGMVLLALVIIIALLAMLGTVAHASGLVDDTVDAGNLYSKYPLSNYQLDFYVDNSWSWLPWNWLDGIGKSVQYGLYCITNFVWTISLYLSNATGYVVQEAYKLDFVNDMADSIGQSIQTLAGVTANGFSSSGFYVGFLLLLILIVGIYVAYTGLIKRETSKAIHAVINFLVVFLVSASFIAYAPDYIKKVNDFSSDISTASLDLGTKIMLPDSDSKGKDSVDLIRDSLFSIQVQQPWLLLQFGNSSIEEIGADRVDALVSVSPSDEDGATREDVVKTEIEDKDNDNMTIPQVVNRLGMVFFLLIFNLGITIFVFLLTAMMIFSQILFIIFAMFLPVSFLLSMIPSYEGMAKQAVVKVFNTIMTRAGITLIVTVAFSISSMFYNMSSDYPFFMVAFLQIVTFAGIYFKLGDIMSMFSLNAGDSQTMGRRIFRRPYMFMRHRARRMERRMARAVGAGSMAGSTAGTLASSLFSGRGGSARKSNQNKEQRNNTTSGSFGSRAGAKAGAVMDTKNRVKDKAKEVKEAVKDMPTQAGYAVYSAKENAKKTVSDFKRGVTQEQETRQSGRTDKLNQRRQSVAGKRMEMQKAQEARHSEKKADGSATKAKEVSATRQHERPAVTPKPEAKTTPKAEDKKRPAVTTPITTTGKETAVKERPVTAGASIKVPEQRQSVQRQTVKAGDAPKATSTQEVKQNVQRERTVKNQQTRQVQSSQKSQQTSQKKTTTHKKKGRRK